MHAACSVCVTGGAWCVGVLDCRQLTRTSANAGPPVRVVVVVVVVAWVNGRIELSV
jgi:hypothetical protein